MHIRNSWLKGLYSCMCPRSLAIFQQTAIFDFLSLLPSTFFVAKSVPRNQVHVIVYMSYSKGLKFLMEFCFKLVRLSSAILHSFNGGCTGTMSRCLFYPEFHFNG